jgi:hypothetical protein
MINEITLFLVSEDCRGRDRIVCGFTTICAISAYHWICLFASSSWRGVLDATLCNNIQLMTFHKVDTVIYQPRGSDVHRSQRLR